MHRYRAVVPLIRVGARVAQRPGTFLEVSGIT